MDWLNCQSTEQNLFVISSVINQRYISYNKDIIRNVN